MRFARTLLERLRQFGLRRSIGLYLVIVIGLMLASELAVEHLIGQMAAGDPAAPMLNAFVIAALAGFFVVALFQGAVADRERANVALGNSEERFKSLTSLSADWFWETDCDYRLSWIAGGQPMLKLFGSELAYGKRIWEIPGIVVPEVALKAHLDDLAARASFHELELCRPGPSGECAEYHLISGAPRRDASGAFAGYRGVGRDVTSTRRAEQALSSARERLELALQTGENAIWDSDLSSGSIYLSAGWSQMRGEPPAEQRCDLATLLKCVHPDDRERVTEASRNAATGASEEFFAEIRLNTCNGDWKWVATSGRVVARDAAQRALRMTGTVVDIDRRKRAEHAMRDAEARYRTLVELSPDGVLLQSDGRIEYANRAAAGMLGAGLPAALFGRNLLDLVHPESAGAMRERSRYLLAGPGVSEFREFRLLRADGSSITAEVAGVSYLERGRLVAQIVMRDITERVRAREELAERERRFRDVVEAAGEYVWETDAEFRYTWLSARVAAVLGYVHADLLGKRPQDFMPLGEARAIEERLLGHSRAGEPFRDLTHRSITKSGRVIWQSISGVPVFRADGALSGFRGTGSDITARRLAEERIQYLATRDALTGLPNRLVLADRAGQAILNAGRKRERIAVLSVHLDRFNLVSDTFGHPVGDALLRAVAERLSNTLRKDDTLARLEGEKFVLLWDGTREVEDAGLVAQKVLKALGSPIYIEGRALNASASIGIGVYPGDGIEFVDLLKNADAAAYAAREAGGNTYRFYSAELNVRAVERLEAENDLHRALARREFELHFQPIVRGGRGRGFGAAPVVVGAEVLVRWRHPLRGLLLPDEFLPLAEQSGLMGQLRDWMVEESCTRIAAWREGPLSRLWFALNASTKELSHDRQFALSLGRALDRHGLAGSRFVLEIAERSVRRGEIARQDALQAVADLGVALAIDDFGSGQADLAALRRIPVGKLKIDRSLVAEVAVREDAAVIVQTIAAMARGLGLAVSASGVENAAQVARLREFGCEEWQGLHYSDALEAGAFEHLLVEGQRSAAG